MELVQFHSKSRDCFVTGVQHDAQEFLAFLLEMTHEDLNSATKTHVGKINKVIYDPSCVKWDLVATSLSKLIV